MESGLCHIELKSSNPMDLFREWYAEAKKYCDPSSSFTGVMSLATAKSDGTVNNRNVVIRDIVDDRLIMVTDARGNKCEELSSKIKWVDKVGNDKVLNLVRDNRNNLKGVNPNVAITCLWIFTKESHQYIYQVRISGLATKISKDRVVKYYEKEPLYCKIRSHICSQDSIVDWNDIKKAHDQLFEEVKLGKELPMPEHVVGYQIIPKSLEFYQGEKSKIADRVLFSLQDGNWTSCHLAA